ncbi:MAG: hypothetical protein Q7J45_01295 [bacterium]|nr:hypothetical protein [bacterium]
MTVPAVRTVALKQDGYRDFSIRSCGSSQTIFLDMESLITILGQTFLRMDIPRVARMVDTSRANAEAQIQSLADAWHNGDIRSAIQAFESDLLHG